MKKRTLLTCGLAAALFAGCSSDDKLTVDDGTVSNGTGYVSLRIALPSSSGGMRANNQANDQFDEGVADEYKVNDITLVFFNSSEEVLATHKLAGFSASATDDNDGITIEQTLATQKVSNNAAYVLVLINKPDDIDTDVAKFDDINKALDCSDVKVLTGSSYNSFYMSNTTLSDGTKSQTLVPVSPKTTEDLAVANKVNVYVERAVGKVEMSYYTGSGTNWSSDPDPLWVYTIPDDAAVYAKDKISINGWNIDLTNTKTYPVRKFNNDWATNQDLQNRMLSSSAIESGSTWKRTYWAEDPNYSADVTTGALKENTTFSDMDNKLYCPENTFDVEHMKQKNSTRVLLKAKYQPNGFSDGETWYLLANSSTPKHEDAILTAVKAVVPAVTDLALPAGVTPKDEYRTSYFLKGSDEVTSTELSDIQDAISSITKYDAGICYYAVRIQHFGSFYTPWGSELSAPSVAGDTYYNYLTSHTDNAKNYLGRYGIVRNNWYQLELGTISAPGEPTIPKATENADDVTNYYISATVKIMDWAVRKQSVNL